MTKPIEMTLEEIEEFKEEIKKEVMEEMMKLIEKDDQGRWWINDKKDNTRFDITNLLEEKSASNQKAIKDASQMSLQKKEKRLVANLPEWMKDKLKERAKRNGTSMNEIIRTAIAEYLSKE